MANCGAAARVYQVQDNAASIVSFFEQRDSRPAYRDARLRSTRLTSA
jgi:hypothetical protein